MNFLDKWHRRRANAHRELAESENQRMNVEAQWPEIRKSAAWAKQTRERNHLTTLFIDSLGGKP